jgi:hypothetical protein
MRPRSSKAIYNLSKHFGFDRAFAEKDDDAGEEEDKDGDGSSGTGADDDDSDDDTGSGTDDKSIKDPDKKKLSEEAKQHRLRAKNEKARADKAEAELRKLSDKDKSELEKAQRDLDETTKERDKLREISRTQGLRLAFFESGAADLLDPTVKADALKLLDLSDLEPDDEGDFDEKALRKRVEDFLKERPKFARNTSESDDDKNQSSSGRPLNGQRKTGKEADRQLLEKKFPALQGR